MSATGAKGDQQFEDLLKSLNDLNAAAAPAGAAGGNPEDDDEDADNLPGATAADNDGDADNGGKHPVMKSITATDADGNAVEAVDATELLKSMQDTLDRHDGMLAKSLTPLMQAVVKQGEVIKSLQDQISKLGNKGAGRQSVLVATSLNSGVSGSRSGTTGVPSREEFIAKATAAWEAQKLTGQELTACDVAIRESKPLDPSILKKVLG